VETLETLLLLPNSCGFQIHESDYFLLLVRQILTHPPPLPGLGTGYVETT
jgi:hypothetical protein